MTADLAGYRIRLATVADVATIARHRAAMFRDMGDVSAAEQPQLEAASARYVARALAAGDYRGWLAERDGGVAAGAGVVLRPLLPSPAHLEGGTEAYVLNVYTELAHRRHGLARALMEHVIDWCRTQGVARVRLHASAEGRPLYASLGFTATTEMGWDIR